MFLSQTITPTLCRVLLRLITGTLFFTLGLSARAQTWEALNPPLNIFNGTISATTVDASGHIYAGGGFKNAAGNNFVATWNGATWIEVGGGTAGLNANGSILTLASFNDTVYAAGAFTNRASNYSIAKWNGSSWKGLDSNSALFANGFIYSLATDRAGNVYAAGGFTDASGKNFVAKWNGTEWKKLGSGTTALNANATIYAVAVDAAGAVYAGGYFTNAAGKQYVAKWDGAAWSEVGTGAAALNANDYINCLATDASGNVYAGGGFRNGGGENYLAKWNGSSWTEMGSGADALHANSTVKTVAVKNEREVYVAGIFTNYGGTYYVARWNGSGWSEVNSPVAPLLTNDRVESLSVDAAGTIYAGGKFLNKSGRSYLAKWDGTGWSEPGATGDPLYTSQPIYQLVGDSVGNIYVAGNFQDNGGRYYLQYWNGKSWKRLSIPDTAGLSLFSGGKHPMVLDRKGTLYVPGRKTDGSTTYDCVLSWDGTRWRILEDFPNSLGTYNSNPAYGINELETDPQENIYAAGNFTDAAWGQYSLAKWNGTIWTKLPGSYANYIQRFCVTADSNIYAFGAFQDEVGRAVIVNYNAAKQRYWTEVKNGTSRFGVPGYNVFSALASDDKNNLYVNGYFTNSSGNRYLAKWDGTNWTEVGTTSSLGLGLAIDPYNNLYANKDASTYNDPVRTWNGTSWVSAGALGTIGSLNFTASLLATDAAGNVYSEALSPEPGVGSYIVRLRAGAPAAPKLSSFTPTRGSLGTPITITGKNLSGTTAVRFGGTDASSFTLKNDSTIVAVVAYGTTGSVWVKTAAGEDSLQTFTYTCDSVKGPVPTLSLLNDSVLASSPANYYQWYFNNNKLPNAVSRTVVVRNAGFYRVETSAERTCWVPSVDYPVLVGRAVTADSLQLIVYPNPSTGYFVAYLKLPQVYTGFAYVQVYDVTGVPVFQTSKMIFYGKEIRIPITLNTKGTFFLRITVNNKTVQQSVIIL